VARWIPTALAVLRWVRKLKAGSNAG